jgi:hypothetical protein
MNKVLRFHLRAIKYLTWHATHNRLLHRHFENTMFHHDPLGHSEEHVTTRGQDASNLIAEGIRNGKPFMVARFGHVELNCMTNYLATIKKGNLPRRVLDYLVWNKFIEDWENRYIADMCHNAGFFPSSPQMTQKFSELMIRDMGCVDVLASWLRHEKLFDKELGDIPRIHLNELVPYCHEHPWSAELEGLNVLVVHPFEDSIRQQYEKRRQLFADPRTLPDFNLKIIKSVQSICNNPVDFPDWFAALDSMKDQISETEFDVAIIGCGAYGFPLAAHVKRMGKISIHMGGATQNLFGIIGKRWETIYGYAGSLYNDHWSRPLPSEYPKDGNKIEGGAYW